MSLLTHAAVPVRRRGLEDGPEVRVFLPSAAENTEDGDEAVLVDEASVTLIKRAEHLHGGHGLLRRLPRSRAVGLAREYQKFSQLSNPSIPTDRKAHAED